MLRKRRKRERKKRLREEIRQQLANEPKVSNYIYHLPEILE
jgi:hypothetical protein